MKSKMLLPTLITLALALLPAGPALSIDVPFTMQMGHKYADYQYSTNTLTISNGTARLDSTYSNGAKYQQVRLHSGVKLTDNSGNLIGGCITNHHLPAAGLHGGVERSSSCEFPVSDEDAQRAIVDPVFLFHRNEAVGPSEGEVSAALLEIALFYATGT